MTSVASQTRRLIPDFINENHPRFVRLIELHLKFIEETHVQNGKILHRPQDLLNNLILSHDVDRTNRSITPKNQVNDADVTYTVTKFLEFYKQNYMALMPYYGPKGQGESRYYDRTDATPPAELSTEFTSLIKRIRDFYRNKGNVSSYDFFFRAIFNAGVEVVYPKEDILRVSDGEWYEPYYIRLAFYPDDQEVDETNWQDVDILQVSDFDLIYNRVVRAFEYVYEDGVLVYEDDGITPKKNILARAVVGPRVFISNVVEAWNTDLIPWITLIEREGNFSQGVLVDICEICDQTANEIELDNLLDQDGKVLRILASNVDDSWTYVGSETEYESSAVGGDLVGDSSPESPIVAYEGANVWNLYDGSSSPTALDGTVNPEYIGLETRFEGRWLSNDGFISDNKFLQDNYYYQDFSYEIRTSVTRNVWDQLVDKNLHPAGMILFNVLLAEDVNPFVFTVNFDRQWQIYWETVVNAAALPTLAGRMARLKIDKIFNVYVNSHQFETQDRSYFSRLQTIEEGELTLAYPDEYATYHHPLNSTWVFVNGRKLDAYDNYVYLKNSVYQVDWKLGRDSELHSVFDGRVGETEYNFRTFHLNTFDKPIIQSDHSLDYTLTDNGLSNDIEISNIPNDLITAIKTDDLEVDEGGGGGGDEIPGPVFEDPLTEEDMLVFYDGKLVTDYTLTVDDTLGTVTLADLDETKVANEIGSTSEDIEPLFEIISMRGRNRVLNYYTFTTTQTLPLGTNRNDVLVFGGADDEFLTLLTPGVGYVITSSNDTDEGTIMPIGANTQFVAIVLNSYIYDRRDEFKTLNILTNTSQRFTLERFIPTVSGREAFQPYAIGGVHVFAPPPDPLNLITIEDDQYALNLISFQATAPLDMNLNPEPLNMTN